MSIVSIVIGSIVILWTVCNIVLDIIRYRRLNDLLKDEESEGEE